MPVLLVEGTPIRWIDWPIGGQRQEQRGRIIEYRGEINQYCVRLDSSGEERLLSKEVSGCLAPDIDSIQAAIQAGKRGSRRGKSKEVPSYTTDSNIGEE